MWRLAEARLVDYARMKFAPLQGVPYALEGRLDGEVICGEGSPRCGQDARFDRDADC